MKHSKPLIALLFIACTWVALATTFNKRPLITTIKFKILDSKNAKPVSNAFILISQGEKEIPLFSDTAGIVIANISLHALSFEASHTKYKSVKGSFTPTPDSIPQVMVYLGASISHYKLIYTPLNKAGDDLSVKESELSATTISRKARIERNAGAIETMKAPAYESKSISTISYSEAAPVSTYLDTRVYDSYTEPPSPPSGESISGRGGMSQQAKARMLTAGEVNDFSKWNLWQDIQQTELGVYRKTWGLYPEKRYTILVQDEDRFPLTDAQVQLYNHDDKLLWEARTDNTGKAELWPCLIDTTTHGEGLHCKVNYHGVIKEIGKLTDFHSGINIIKLKATCQLSNKVDIGFVVDATGSMSDEIEFLKTELNDVMTQARTRQPELSFNLGSVFYRDFGDAYLTRISPLSSDISQTIKFIQQQGADGGGDTPEAADTAMLLALENLGWSEDARTRILFVVLDAPPHQGTKELARLRKITTIAAAKGIRIVPLAASGIDKSTEYLMRCIALATNGTYVFLTDDSGIGDKHIKPTTDKFDVELLNDLMLRLIKQYTTTSSCKQPIVYKDSAFKDTMLVHNKYQLPPNDSNEQSHPIDSSNKPVLHSWRYFPNPTYGRLTIEVDGTMGEIFLVDQSGKIMNRYRLNQEQSSLIVDLADYSPGVYYLKYYINDKQSLDGKVVLLRE